MEELRVTGTNQQPSNESGARVKFTAHWLGTVEDCLSAHRDCQEQYRTLTSELASALALLERSGATPVCPDGRVAGNAAARIHVAGVDMLIVSMSGKLGGRPISVENDFCIVTNFDRTHWTVDYYAHDEAVLPTSDTPLHYVALHCGDEFGWTVDPLVSLHGHAVATAEAAERLHLPCSTVETLFSTPEDSCQLLSLMKQYQYPQNKIFVRKGHGFLILGHTTAEAVNAFECNIHPFM